MPRFIRISALVVISCIAAFTVYVAIDYAEKYYQNEADKSLSTALLSVQRHNKLIVFSAVFNAVQTNEEDKFLRRGEKTLVIPGLIYYFIDMDRLNAKGSGSKIEWDPSQKLLRVTLPQLMIDVPNMQVLKGRSYDKSTLAFKLFDSDKGLNKKNYKGAIDQIREQARNPILVSMAKDAAVHAITHDYQIFFKALGVKATVLVGFPGESFREVRGYEK